MDNTKRIEEIKAKIAKGGLTFEDAQGLQMELEELESFVPEEKTGTKTILPVKTHWKKLKNPDYLGSYDFQPNEERIVTVKNVVVETVKNAEGAGSCTVIHFMENYKPMILNTTNGKTLTKIFETPYIEEWTGKQFKLVVKSIKAFGEIVDALRVKSEKVVKVKPTLVVGSKQFIACQERYKADKNTLVKIEEHYTMSPETKKALTNG